jgi:hypothetical protein
MIRNREFRWSARAGQRPRAWTVGFLGTAALVVSLNAAAQSHPYYLSLLGSIGHDSNLLRLYDGQDVGAPYSKADTSYQTAFQGGIDQSFGRQRFSADLSLRDVRYAGNALFNNQGYSGSVGLDWSTVERISGNLSANVNRSLSSFNSYQIGLLTSKNFEDARGASASVSVGLVTQYSLEVSAGYRAVTNTLDNDIIQARNFKQTNGGALLRWRPSSATSLSLGVREVQGRYPKYARVDGAFQADRYRQDLVDLVGSVSATGASSVDARISHSSTRYDLNAARSFSGFTGTAGWTWQATGKLRLSTRYTRDIGQDSYAVTVFGNVPGSSDFSRLVNTLQFNANFEASPKIAATMALVVTQRDVVQTIVNPLLPLNARGRDLSNVLSLGVRWAPLRSVTAGCDGSFERRTASGEIVAPLHSNGLSCFGQLQLQP